MISAVSRRSSDASRKCWANQQEELGRQQEALGAKAEKELRSLMTRAIQSGVAQEVK